MKDIVNIGVVNFKIYAGNKEKNLERICGYVEAASKRGADLVLFPEMALLGYDYYVKEEIPYEEKWNEAETIPGSSTEKIAQIAKENNVYVVLGMPERVSSVMYNSAVAIGPEGIIGTYRKLHPFETESVWCEKGEEPFMFDTKWGPISIGICYDTYQFPELMRYYVDKGSRLYLNPTALVEEIPKEGSRQAFLNYYKPTTEYGVLCNTIYIASSNLVGTDIDNYFGGGSCIIGPKETPFFETDVHTYGGDFNDSQPGLSIATIDLSLATRRLVVPSQHTGVPDYRPDVYKKFK